MRSMVRRARGPSSGAGWRSVGRRSNREAVAWSFIGTVSWSPLEGVARQAEDPLRDHVAHDLRRAAGNGQTAVEEVVVGHLGIATGDGLSAEQPHPQPRDALG